MGSHKEVFFWIRAKKEEKFLKKFTIAYLKACFRNKYDNTIYDTKIPTVTKIDSLDVINYLQTSKNEKLKDIRKINEFKGKNILFVAGGIGLAPVRCVIWNVLDLRDNYKDIAIVYGARTVDDLVYKRELKEWEERSDVKLFKTVDPGGENQEWDGKIGFVPTVLEQSGLKGDNNSIAIVCGPPIMIKLTIPVLKKIGFTSDKIYTTLENKMKCGLGKCGRCNVGNFYVCKHGPVVTASKLGAFSPINGIE